MLYLDSSALIKCYVQEVGSANVLRRLRSGEPVFTSWLTYAEVVTVLGRKLQARQVDVAQYGALRIEVEQDWAALLTLIEVNSRSMALLPDLTSRYPLKSSDALHLSTALWLQAEYAGPGMPAVEFGTADQSLARMARSCSLRVFNPESATP